MCGWERRVGWWDELKSLLVVRNLFLNSDVEPNCKHQYHQTIQSALSVYYGVRIIKLKKYIKYTLLNF